MTTCLKCGREVRGAGKLRHLLCFRCRRRKEEAELPRPGAKTHIVNEESVARLRCRATTLCGRSIDDVATAAENEATCRRCKGLLKIHARNQAYMVALKLISRAARIRTAGNDVDPLLCEALEQIAEELEARAEGRVYPARMVGPEILRRARERKGY